MSDDAVNLDLFAPRSEPAGHPDAVDRDPPRREDAQGPSSRGESPRDGAAETGVPVPLHEPPPLWPDDDAARDVTSGPGLPTGGTAAPEAALADQASPAVHGEPRSTPVWTVTQVNRGVRTLLESTFGQVWVGGEVGRWTRHLSGHCYFTLKDERSQLRCVMFQSDAARLPTDPEEGMTVRVLGSLTLYEARGAFQLVVRRLESGSGEGLWRLAFQRLQAKLEAEGLLDPARKRPIPAFPRAVGVVTSATGAALRDILTVLSRRAPWTRVVLRSARVQGEGAGTEVAAAIEALGSSGLVDVVIAGRGGGSIEDLWAFNEEAVARAIAACPVPVISAVGHEVDVTMADLVADHRAPTPSAAAEAAVPDRASLARTVEAGRVRMIRGLQAGVARRAERARRGVLHLGRAARRLLEPRRQATRSLRLRLERAVRRALEPRRRTVGEVELRLRRAMDATTEGRRRRLETLTATMNALSPLATLTRGYAVPLDSEGRVLRTVDRFQPGMRFDLRVVDGRVVCQVRESNPSEKRADERE